MEKLLQKLSTIESLINEIRDEISSLSNNPRMTSDLQSALADALSKAGVQKIDVPDLSKHDIFTARKAVLSFCTEVVTKGYMLVVKSAVERPDLIDKMDMNTLQKTVDSICEGLPSDMLPIARSATLFKT